MSASRLSFALALLLGACPLLAVEGANAPIRPISILEWDAAIYVRAEVETDERTTETATSKTVTTEEEWNFEEGLEASVTGYVYHPNLMWWRVGIDLARTQESITLNGQEFKTNGDLRGYDISVLFLQEKPVSLWLFASKRDDVRDRDFSQNTRTTERRHGGELRYRGPFVATLLAEWIEQTETGDRLSTEEKTSHYRLVVTDQRDRDWLTEFTYDREETDRVNSFTPTGGGAATVTEFPDTTDEVQLTNLWRFGPEEPEKHTLSGQILLMRRRGFFENDVITADQRLDFVHSETLSTFYLASFNSDETVDQTDRVIDAEIGVVKNIYDSLDITFRVEGHDRSVGESGERRIGAFFEADYRKETPIGYYTSSLLVGREKEHEQFPSGQRTIIDESVTLIGTTFVALNENNVVPGSVVVTDITGTIFYATPGDYVLRTTGVVTEIRRVLGGLIGDGDTVLVDYITAASPDLTFITDHFTWEHRLEIKDTPVAVYGEYRLFDEQIVDGQDPGNLDRIRSFLGGVELDYKGFLLTLEHEQSQQKLSPPWRAYRASATYRTKLARDLALTVGANVETLEYLQAGQFGLQPGAESLDSASAHAALTAKLGRNSLLRFDVTLSDYSGRENRTELESSVSFEWRYAKLDFSVDAHYDMYTDQNLAGTTEDSGQSASLMVYVKRRF